MQRELVERAMAGDHGAFAELARASIGRLYAAARLILRDDHRAEDATQEALVAAWRDLSALRDPDRFEAWLHRLLVRAYQTIDNGIYKLWIVSTAPGSKPRQVGTQTSSWQGRLTSPDGGTLITYFGGDSGSGWTIQRVDLATGRVTPMTIGDDLSWQRLALQR
jgi:hypothetical protein